MLYPVTICSLFNYEYFIVPYVYKDDNMKVLFYDVNKYI